MLRPEPGPVTTDQTTRRATVVDSRSSTRMPALRSKKLPLRCAFVAAIALVLLLRHGCPGSAGRVRKLVIDPHRVHCVAIGEQGSALVITDRQVVRSCVEELNAHSWTPHPPRKGVDGGVPVAFRDSHGRAIVTIGIPGVPTAQYIVVIPSGCRPFSIRYESLPTIGRLFAYGTFVDSRDLLQEASRRGEGDAEWWRHVPIAVWSINRSYTGVSLRTPADSAELRELLKCLDSVSVDDLPRFVDSFEAK